VTFRTSDLRLRERWNQETLSAEQYGEDGLNCLCQASRGELTGSVDGDAIKQQCTSREVHHIAAQELLNKILNIIYIC
jgi:hypothetical protein